MNLKDYKAVMEGLVFASGDEGISKRQLEIILELETQEVDRLIKELKDDYKQQDRGIAIMESNSVFHLTTKPEHSRFYQKMKETPQSSRLSQAALETLAIVAYRQPITRTEIEDIRGVKSDRPVQTLLSRSLVKELGRKESIGRPILYGTSTEFLSYFGLRSIDELPPLPEGSTSDDTEDEADLFFQSFQNEEN